MYKLGYVYTNGIPSLKSHCIINFIIHYFIACGITGTVDFCLWIDSVYANNHAKYGFVLDKPRPYNTMTRQTQTKLSPYPELFLDG